MQVRNVSQATFDEFRGRLLASHRALVTSNPEDPNAGYIRDHGVDLTYKYHPDTHHLDVGIDFHPFWVAPQAIQEQFRQRLAECAKHVAANTETVRQMGAGATGQDA